MISAKKTLLSSKEIFFGDRNVETPRTPPRIWTCLRTPFFVQLAFITILISFGYHFNRLINKYGLPNIKSNFDSPRAGESDFKVHFDLRMLKNNESSESLFNETLLELIPDLSYMADKDRDKIIQSMSDIINKKEEFLEEIRTTTKKETFDNLLEHYEKAMQVRFQSSEKPLKDGMAACLLVNDENERLPEWLAYHYQSAQLRKVIIAIKPSSTGDPRPLLNRWAESNLGLEFEIWDDSDFMPLNETVLKEKMEYISTSTFKNNKVLKKTSKMTEEDTETLLKHAAVREKEFISWCMYDLKQKGWTWTLLINPNEYLMFNKINPARLERKGLLTGETKTNLYNHPNRIYEITKMRKELQNIEVGQINVYQYIMENKNSPPFLDEPCMPLPQLFFEPVESGNSEVLTQLLQGFSGNSQQYKNYVMKGKFKDNLLDKSLVDVSRIPSRAMDDVYWYTSHRPLKECYDARPYDYELAEGKWKYDRIYVPNYTPLWRTLFRIHHYLGPWESRSNQGYQTKSRNPYDRLGKFNKGDDDDGIQTWLSSFVRNVGDDIAIEVLKPG
mmetsp:Transcript_30614/g.60601  ORF Transcript_30614/g.60601 Transcript_30614/m.60601 type:complete len:559 (-) Transcript_30614:82-1758(-)